MAAIKTLYVCSACGATAPKWAGQCSGCSAWNTLSEQRTAVQGPGKRAGYAGEAKGSKVRLLSEISAEVMPRISSGSSELDRVLGGGLVHGSVILVGGDPGIGKSTLLVQTLARLSADYACLYVSGEESGQQISARAERIGIACEQLQLLSETSVESILSTASVHKPRIMVVDSIQTLYSEQLQSAPGSVSQVRESAAQLVQYAKHSDTTVFLVGHVTKDGSIAGPRVLEHMVDTVLYFEGDAGSQLRMIRAMKNRFGAVNELGLFAMTEKGLKQVSNPSAIFLDQQMPEAAGRSVLVTREGTRPLLVEVQALVDESHISSPRRVALGLDQNRLAMLLAVLHRHGGIPMFDQDVYINVVGGVRITETAADLPVLMAILSSFRDRHLPVDLAMFGEIGLSGELRPVPNGQERIREAAKHGFKRIIIPAANKSRNMPEGIEILAVARLTEALALY
ncbi:MAG: DNA repair protein RadA [gamma proteobacterium symbiont of Bathyaustriella thionipta]|nr:DNA repair protein RadA [gamma proteobacterium symbiont of Bathyaustriella thionipta]